MFRAASDASGTPLDRRDRAQDPGIRRMGVLVFVLGAALTGLLVALVPPTAHGPVGWAVAAAAIGVRLAAAARLAAPWGSRMRLSAVYGVSVFGIASLCVLQYLASAEAFYHDLLLIDLVYVAAVHGRTRTILAVALAVGGMVPSLLAAGGGHVSVAEWGAEGILWSLVAGLMLLYASLARGERAALRLTGERAQALARVDALTGLGNRRAFDETLDAQLAQARRYGTPLSIIVGDLDGFKAVNDDHGHPAGDGLLRLVAGRLDETVRRPDACFRWGGDEFAVVLPQTGVREAGLVADRIRAAVSATTRTPGGRPVAISLGIAELGREQEPAELLAAADAALLAAKRGRPATAPAARHLVRGEATARVSRPVADALRSARRRRR